MARNRITKQLVDSAASRDEDYFFWDGDVRNLA